MVALAAAQAPPRLAFVDSALPPAKAPGPVYTRLAAALDDYHRRWGRLPAVVIFPGPTLTDGASGARVLALRRRLGLPPVGAFDLPVRQAVARFQQAHGLPVTGAADAATIAALNLGPAHFEALIRANLERARALPPATGQRYILINVAAQTLGLYEGGRLRLTMPVIIGKPAQQTPEMAGLLRYAVLEPYWNIPPDLVRDTVAPKMLDDPGYAEREGLEILTDWSPAARRLSPAAVDWRAVAAGRTVLRVRQKPGPTNVMGRVKFMLPNPLGIYLHDFPDKALFAHADRRLSAGCIRLSDARALALALLNRDPTVYRGGELRVDLAEPTPVYIAYRTAAPAEGGGVRFFPDVYDRDAAVLAKAEATASTPGRAG